MLLTWGFARSRQENVPGFQIRAKPPSSPSQYLASGSASFGCAGAGRRVAGVMTVRPGWVGQRSGIALPGLPRRATGLAVNDRQPRSERLNGGVAGSGVGGLAAAVLADRQPLLAGCCRQGLAVKLGFVRSRLLTTSLRCSAYASWSRSCCLPYTIVRSQVSTAVPSTMTARTVLRMWRGTLVLTIRWGDPRAPRTQARPSPRGSVVASSASHVSNSRVWCGLWAPLGWSGRQVWPIF